MATTAKNKPGAKAKAKADETTTDAAKTAPSTGEAAIPAGPVVTGDATQPDEVSESAKLGGTTVEELKAEPEDQEPASRLEKSGGRGEMRLTPNDGALLVGNTYTATLQLPDSFDQEAGDRATFMHPAGWDVQASVSAGVASGTFLIERPRQFNFGFKINGKKVASASYETRNA